MTLGTRDKRALALLGGAALVVAVLSVAWQPESAAPAAAPVDSIPVAELRLERLRRTAATVPGKEQLRKQVTAELEAREKGLIRADTPALAQAQLLDVVRRTARALPQSIDFTSIELGQPPSPLGQDYGEVFVSVNFVCPIEDLVNFLAELTAQPEAIATREMRVTHRPDKQKTIGVRLTISGIVPRSLVPNKRGAL
ncbi:MAG TPA: type II secretion system protein GspM [Bryobacteraceae bacterium]|nr:type II secretion system protein GspM [Bryobacteraceae bacterium]